MSKKPLGHKAYGHIPHLPGSRMGPGDHHCDEGQKKICTQKARDKHDLIIVQEKVDGTNVAITRIDGQIIPLTRSGYRAETSKYKQHHMFAKWVMQNTDRFEFLKETETINGEWMVQAHGTRYKLPHEPFVLFDMIIPDEESKFGRWRIPFKDLIWIAQVNKFVMPKLLHIGAPVSIEEIRGILEPSGHGAIDPVEGAVWRVERRGRFDFVAKWVRPDKEDGSYLPGRGSDDGIIWNSWFGWAFLGP